MIVQSSAAECREIGIVRRSLYENPACNSRPIFLPEPKPGVRWMDHTGRPTEAAVSLQVVVHKRFAVD